MYFASMVDMALTPAEAKEDAPQPAASASFKGPRYPYGLSISLGDDELKKLGLDGDLPSAGEMIHLFAMAKVTSAGEHESMDTNGKTSICRRVELQITHLAAENEDQENAEADAAIERDSKRRKRFYPTMDNDNEPGEAE